MDERIAERELLSGGGDGGGWGMIDWHLLFTTSNTTVLGSSCTATATRVECTPTLPHSRQKNYNQVIANDFFC